MDGELTEEEALVQHLYPRRREEYLGPASHLVLADGPMQPALRMTRCSASSAADGPMQYVQRCGRPDVVGLSSLWRAR